MQKCRSQILCKAANGAGVVKGIEYECTRLRIGFISKIDFLQHGAAFKGKAEVIHDHLVHAQLHLTYYCVTLILIDAC